MAEYSIGDVEKLTGVKAHVLRYWEESVPFIRPRKDAQGRRFYGDADVRLVLRLASLVREKKYTIEGAGERLLAERMDTERADALESIGFIRAELTRAHSVIQARKEKD